MVEIIRLLLRSDLEPRERPPTRIVWNEDAVREFAGEAPPEGFSSWNAYQLYVESGGNFVTTFASPGTVPRGRKVSLQWTRDGEDVATIGMHFLAADGTAATDFTDADEATINARLLTLWDALKGHFPTTLALDRFIWHPWGVGVRRPNPATQEYAISPAVGGTADASGQEPPQSAVSVTFKTAVRKQWGRCYLPAPAHAVVVDGRFTSDFCDDVRTAFGDLLDGATDDSLPLVIWSPRHDGGALQYGDGTPTGRAAAHAAGLDDPDASSFARSVLQVQVDDIVDTIRSRRFAKPLVRATHTLS